MIFTVGRQTVRRVAGHSSVTADREQDEHTGHHTEDSHHRQGTGRPDHQEAVSKVDTEEGTNILHVSLVPF